MVLHNPSPEQVIEVAIDAARSPQQAAPSRARPVDVGQVLDLPPTWCMPASPVQFFQLVHVPMGHAAGLGRLAVDIAAWRALHELVHGPPVDMAGASFASPEEARARLPQGDVQAHLCGRLRAAMFFAPMTNLLLPERAAHMGQGWETRRSRPPGEDWIIIALGRPGHIQHAVVDTSFFKGNSPDRCALDALYWPDAPAHALVDHPDWVEVLAPSKLRAHVDHVFSVDHGPATHVRLRIFPDGGVSRLRILGTPTETTPADDDPWLQRVNALSVDGFRRYGLQHQLCGLP